MAILKHYPNQHCSLMAKMGEIGHPSSGFSLGFVAAPPRPPRWNNPA